MNADVATGVVADVSASVIADAGAKEKVCITCKDSLPEEMFDESDLSKDGRALLVPRCRSCEKRLEDDREVARRKAAEEAKGSAVQREYIGVRGGLLIAGYVK